MWLRNSRKGVLVVVAAGMVVCVMCVCVCAHVHERDRESIREGERGRRREGKERVANQTHNSGKLLII